MIYAFTYCDNAFSNSTNMKIHERIHTSERFPHALTATRCLLHFHELETHMIKSLPTTYLTHDTTAKKHFCIQVV